MREIPSLQALCLRSVGGCSAEVTFAKDPKSGAPSSASRLLRSFHHRPIVGASSQEEDGDDDDKTPDDKDIIHFIPMERTPCIGDGSARRMQANEVDLNHPMIGHYRHPNDDDTTTSNKLVMQHGNPALDCLQSYIDSLVELGRMDGARLGFHFFEEWKQNVVIAAANANGEDTTEPTPTPKKSKKRRRNASEASAASTTPVVVNPNGDALGSLSLHNCTVSTDTIEAMVEAGMGPYLGVLDLTGIHGMTDSMLEQLLPTCPHLYRLSMKNCRRITGKSLETMAVYQTKLTCLDVGGSFNITKQDILDAVPSLPQLDEIHASGLEWNDASIDALVDLREWKALSLAFSYHLSQASLKASLCKISDSLTSLAMAFCEDVVDNALLGMMGRNLPQVRFLDVRGCANLSTLTGWFDGRASANLPPQPLHVLGRYSGLSESSVEETKRVHPLDAADLTVILDGTGTGTGITVESRNR